MPKIQGKVIAADAEGCLLTDLHAEQLADAPRGEETTITCDEHVTLGIFAPDHGQPHATFVAILNPAGTLELQIVGENAALMLGISVGAAVTVQW